MNKAFKALGDSTRREILALLRDGEKTAGDLAESFDMTKPSMSHHFSVLKDADLDHQQKGSTTNLVFAQYDGGAGCSGMGHGSAERSAPK